MDALQKDASDDRRLTELIQQHGALLGPVLYDAEKTARDKAAGAFVLVKAKLDAATIELESREAILTELLSPLREDMDAAYAVWLTKCERLESTRIAIEQELSPLRQRVADLTNELRGPLIHSDRVQNWGRPEWYRPETDH